MSRPTQSPGSRSGPLNENDAAQNLVAAIIGQAVSDLKALNRLGFIVGGKAAIPQQHERTREARQLKLNSFQPTRQECESLLGFFAEGGAMDSWLDVSGLKLDGGRVRKQLGVLA